MSRNRRTGKRDKPRTGIPPALQRQHNVPGLSTSVEHFYITKLLHIFDFNDRILLDHVLDTIHTNRIAVASLIVYFSRADENYFSGALRVIPKGNTEIAAEMLQTIMGADLFKIEPLIPHS